MYDYEIHHTVVNIAKDETPSEDEINALNCALALEEQKNVISLCSALMEEKSIEGIIECYGCDEEFFCKRYDVSAETLQKWKTEGLSNFEYNMLIFVLCQSEISEDRIHICPTCRKMFHAYMPKDGICSECRAEMLLRTDDFLSP